MKTAILLAISALTFTIGNAQKDAISFQKKTLFADSVHYISEGVAFADVNKDGKKDIFAGSYWFEAPKWKMHELYTPEKGPVNGYGHWFFNFAMDVNQDGWEDMIRVGFPGDTAYWYENPKGKTGHWQQHAIYHSVGNESPDLVDVDGDGRLDLLCNDSKSKKVVWISPPVTKGDTAWTAYTISSDTLIGTHMYTHGIGLGDINGDGRKDVVIRTGWWEAPEDRKQKDWTYHPAPLSEECSQMYVVDVDLDGDSDIVSASAHDYGIWWHEQVKEGDSVRWETHDIFKEFSQSHGMALKDINKDGYPDLITGKRFWAHNGHDRGEREPAVIYWFEFKPGKTPVWIPHLIDNNSGVGQQIAIADINNDGLLDMATSNKKGVFVFTQNAKSGKR